jgi:hypothetical protein
MASLATTFDEAHWCKGAELGWTALLVGEDAGGDRLAATVCPIWTPSPNSSVAPILTIA